MVDVNKRKYLGIINVMGSGSFAYGETPDDAARKAKGIFLTDFKGILTLKPGRTVKVNVFDVDRFPPKTRFTWGDDGVFAIFDDNRESLDRHSLIEV